MSKNTDQLDMPDAWGPCPAGELAHMAARLDAHRRIRTATRAISGSVAVMAAAAVVLAFGFFKSPGPISCQQCQSHFAEYYQHQTGQQDMEDAVLVRQMVEHLAHCPHCRSKYEAAYPELALNVHPSTRRANWQPGVRALQAPRSDRGRRETASIAPARPVDTALHGAMPRTPAVQASRVPRFVS